MNHTRRGSVGVISLLLCGALCGGVASGEGPAPVEAQNSPERLCELGITYALSGEVAAAESIFVSLLSQAPGDPRALNNLGNIHLGRGDVGLALAFYDRAGQADSADAGIVLNEATALMIGGEDEWARERAAEGIRRAGGPEEAGRLLGLRYASPDSDAARAADPAQVSREEVLALLRAAAGSVPADSTAEAQTATADKKSKDKKQVPAWRSAGARGAADTDVTAVVYWKR